MCLSPAADVDDQNYKPIEDSNPEKYMLSIKRVELILTIRII